MQLMFETGTYFLQKTKTLFRNKNFVLKDDGNIGVLLGMSLLPVIAAMGTAIDYSRASTVRTKLQNAVDSTVLSVAENAPILTQSQIQSAVEVHFRATLNFSPELGALPLTVIKSDKRLSVSVSGMMETSFLKLVGINRVPVGTAAEAIIGQRKVELALVLDNTGSMARLSKMDELKKATRNLINAAEAAVLPGSGQIRIALVPFDTEVKVDANLYRPQSWLAFKDNARDSSFDDIRSRMAKRDATWTGCITDRGPGFDASDRRVDVTRPESFHPAVHCTNTSLARLQPLTDNWDALRNAADSMQPSGCTNVTIGARFGMATLSPNEPIGGGAAFGTADVDKYMIILTDGDNTRNRFTDRCGPGGSAAAIDTRTTAMCDDIKSKSSRRDAKGNPIPDVRIFTIRVLEGNRAMLTNCATNASMYKEVNNASEIDAVFKDILREITRLQLTS
ncbi:MAG: pilus assembly protein TadG-related protein [Beijerinckiaceae bacterium]